MLDPWLESIGIPVIADRWMSRGDVLRGQWHDGRTFVVAHPLDVIALKHHRDPLARLEEAMAWIVQDAHNKLDRLVQ